MFRLPLPIELDKEPKEVKSIVKIRDKNAYANDRLVIMPRDRHTMFAYFDFGSETLRALRPFRKDSEKTGKGIEAYLGIFSEDNEYEYEEHIHFDLRNEKTMNWYFNNLQAGTKYHSALYIPSIEFFLRSNIAKTC